MTLKVRVIPCLDVKDGRVVKGVNFVNLRDAGDPVESAIAYDKAGADELCFLDITASHEDRGILLDVVRRTAEVCFMPLTVGGGVRTPAAAPARLTVSREESPRTAQVAPDQVPAPTPAQSAPGASWRKPERVAGGVAADRLPERQPVKASLDAGVADSLLGKLAALDNEIKE